MHRIRIAPIIAPGDTQSMSNQKTLTRQSWAQLGLLSLIWGGSFLSIRLALDEVPVLTAVAHRVVWAAVVLWGIVALRRLPLPRDPRLWGAFVVMGVLNNAIPFSLMAWGQLHIPTGLTAILNAATAIWGVAVAAILFADERLTLRKTLGVITGVLGVATAIGLGNLTALDLTSLAQLAVIAGTMSYALAAAWARLYLGQLHPVVAAAGMLTGAALILVPLAGTVDGMPSWDLSPVAIAAIAYYALVATALAYLLYYRILNTSGSGNVLLVTLLVAPTAMILGRIVLDEALGKQAYVGFVLLSLGLIILDGRAATAFRRRLGL